MITKPETPPPSLVRASRKRKVLPASWMRAGTSKGLFIQRKHLPEAQEAWSTWILAAMGSKNADPRQLDGIGGATSTTSKVAIVSPSHRPGIDVEYTFAQVAVGKHKVDYSGNCGNIASGVGPFALEEGMVEAMPGQKYV
jgi:2-methylaconitate cis-trans-isomerase PrpF